MFLEENRMKKLLCVLLSLVMLVCAFPVSAAEGEFLMFTVAQFCAEENMTQWTETVGYSDGKNLYVPIDFFEAYMPYVFDEESSAFVRSDHMANSKYGRLELDFDAKKAKLYLTPFESNTYDLENVFSFGEQYFLPLAQIAAYLKAAVTVEGTIIHVLNSGYSLADAEYALSVADRSKLLKYDIQDVIDDIYVGSEFLFKTSACLGYFGSVIFGLRLDKLDFVSNIGDIKDYIQFLEKCVTDNDGYIHTITEDFNLVERFNLAADVNEKVHSKSQILGDTTEILKTLSEQNKDSSLGDALMYVDARDWNALFDTISEVTDFADYYLKLGSMCEDNRSMLNNFRESGLVTTEDAPFYLAMTDVWGKYGADVVNKIVTRVGEKLVEACTDKAQEVALEMVLPSTEAIKMVATVFKLMGFDLTDNSEYSIMIDLNAVHALKSVYYNDAGHMKNAETAEKYRLAILFWLISVKQTYIAANKLSKKTDGSASLYDDEIEKVQTLIDLFYAAAQSKNIDSFAGLENLKSINEKAVRESGILSAAEKVPEEKAIRKKDNYTEAAIELIYNFPQYGMCLTDTSMGLELIDIDGDDIPEILYSSYVGATGIPCLDGVFAFDGEKYTECKIDEKASRDFPLIPKIESNSGKLIITNDFISTIDLLNRPERPSFASFWYYDTQIASQYILLNKKLTSTELANYQNLYERIEDYSLSDSERDYAWETYKAKVKEFNNQYVLAQPDPFDDTVLNRYYTYTVIDFGSYIDSQELPIEKQLSMYHEKITKDIAEGLVELYNMDHREISYSELFDYVSMS